MKENTQQTINLEKLKADLTQTRMKFTQEFIAVELLGVSQPYLNDKLAGRRPLKLSELQLIAGWMGKDFRKYLESDSRADAAS